MNCSESCPKAMSFVLNLPLDELAQCPSHVVIAGGTFLWHGRCRYATSSPRRCGRSSEAASSAFSMLPLEQVLDRRRVKVPLALHQRVERRIDRKQQLVQFCVGFHRLAALAVQTAFSRVPQIRPARQLASELRHRTVHCDTTHYRGFARLVRSALFQVEQHLEFSTFIRLLFVLQN